MKHLNKLRVALCAAAVVVAVAFFACNKEKESDCKDCYNPTLQEINHFSDFAGKWHNSALDSVLPIVTKSCQKGEEPNIDSILILVRDYCKNVFADYCSTQIDSMFSFKMDYIKDACKESRAQYSIDSILSSDTYFIDFLNTRTNYSTFEKNTLSRIMEICNDSIYENRCNGLSSIKQELTTMGCESELLLYTLSIAQASNDYWEEHLSQYFPEKYPWRKLGMSLLEADFIGGATAAMGLILFHGGHCTGTLIFGPGGVVTCVAGTIVGGAIAGSIWQIGVEIYNAF